MFEVLVHVHVANECNEWMFESCIREYVVIVGSTLAGGTILQRTRSNLAMLETMKSVPIKRVATVLFRKFQGCRLEGLWPPSLSSPLIRAVASGRMAVSQMLAEQSVSMLVSQPVAGCGVCD